MNRIRIMKRAAMAAVITASMAANISLISAATIYWDGTTNGAWGANTNWATTQAGGTDPAAAPGSGDVASFNITGLNSAMIVNLVLGKTVDGLEFTSTGNVTLQGGGTNNVLSLGTGGIVKTGTTGTDTIGNNTATQNVTVSLTGSQSWLNNANGVGLITLPTSSAISLANPGAQTLTLGGSNANASAVNVINSVIGDGSGTLSMAKTGNSTWTLAGLNTFTGNFELSGGRLNVGVQAGTASANALGAGTLTLSGGTLSTAVGTLTTATNVFNPIVVTASTITDLGALTANSNLVLRGAITGSGTIRVNTASVTGGTTQIQSDISGFTGTFDFASSILNSNALTFTSTSATPVFDGSQAKFIVNLSSSGNRAFRFGAGALPISGTVGTASTSSTFKMGELSGTSTGVTVRTDSSVSGLLEIGALNTDSSYAGVFNSLISITKVGTGSLILSGTTNPAYAGLTQVNAGTLQFGGLARLYNNVTADWAKLTVSPGATGMFNVGGTGEFLTGNIDTVRTIANFNPGSNIGFDTTNAGGIFAHNGTLSGSVGVVKGGTGTLNLNNANTYDAPTYVRQGTLAVLGLNSVGGGASELGSPTTVANGTIHVGHRGLSGTLAYTGAGGTTDRVINLAGVNGGATIDSSGTGGIVFSSAVTETGLGNKTVFLAGTATGNSIGGIDDSVGFKTNVEKIGSGEWTLTGANTFTGNLFWVRGGKLNLTGTHNAGSGAYIVGFQNGTTAEVNISNDLTFNHTNPTDYAMEIGTFGTGTVTQTAGTVTTGGAAGRIAIADDGVGGVGTYNLKGGTLDVAAGGQGQIFAGPGTAAFNFSGGTLKVKSFNPNLLGGSFGGLTQTSLDGSSLLDVTGNDTTIRGPYTLTAGTVNIGLNRVLSLDSPMTVGALGIVKGNGVIAGSISEMAGTVAPGASIGTLGISGGATLTGTLEAEYDFNASQVIDLLNVTGALDISAATIDFDNIDLDGPGTALPTDSGYGSGVYIFAKYGSLTGTFASVVDLPAGYGIDYAYFDGVSSNNIALVPEPSTFVLAGLGLVGVTMTIRRRKRA